VTQAFTIKGKVVRILEEKGKITATISYESGLITVPVKTDENVHLNDKLKIDGNFKIEKILLISEDEIGSIKFM